MKKSLMMVLVALCCSMALAAIEIPKASGRALAVTRGKPCSEGVVFVDGRYLEPPYVVERWGVGIRINGTPVIGQVVDWMKVVKTQTGMKVVRKEAEAEKEAEPEATEEKAAEKTEAGVEQKSEASEAKTEESAESDEEKADAKTEAKAEAKTEEASGKEETLDDLFDEDDSEDEDDAAKKSEAKGEKASHEKVERKTAEVAGHKASAKPVRKPKHAKAVPEYTFEGKFTKNSAADAMVKKINRIRTEINATLLSGGFICFGERYARVSGDRGAAEQILLKLPDIQKTSNSSRDLASKARSAGLEFMTDSVFGDLYRNRRDYLKLQVRRDRMKEESKLKSLINNLDSKPRY